MSNTSVQLEGLDMVVESYRSRKIPTFAIFQGRNLNFFYCGDSLDEGEQQLTSFLSMIEQSKAVYTLRVYHDSDLKNNVVRANTPDIGSVNFRLNMEPVGAVGYAPQSSIRNTALEAKLDRVLERLDMQDAIEGEGDAAESTMSGVHNIIGVVKEVMGIPGVSDLVGGILRGVIGGGGNRPGYGLSGLPSTESVEQFYDQFNKTEPMQKSEVIEQENDPELERALMAFVHIRTAVPDALELFEKLAMKSQTDPDKLRSQISMVKNFI